MIFFFFFFFFFFLLLLLPLCNFLLLVPSLDALEKTADRQTPFLNGRSSDRFDSWLLRPIEFRPGGLKKRRRRREKDG